MTVVVVLLGCLFLWIGVVVSLWLNPPLQPVKRLRGKSVTISGRPVEIMPLEKFKIETLFSPACETCAWMINKSACTHRRKPPLSFSLIHDIYQTVVLEGLLLRGIVEPKRVTAVPSAGPIRSRLRKEFLYT